MLTEPEEAGVQAIQILFMGPEWAAVVKPAGIESEKELPGRLSSQEGGDFFPIHRLDLTVGGVMILARTREAAAGFSRMIQEGLFQKEYVALCHGTLPEEGEMRDLLWKDAARNKVYVVQRKRGGVREAVLTYRVLRPAEGPEGLNLVRIRLGTGRTHQIRVQFSSRGCPLAGDHKYGARDDLKNPRLCSCAVSFPWHGKDYRFEFLPPWAGGPPAEEEE